jgi:hypothetical protein
MIIKNSHRPRNLKGLSHQIINAWKENHLKALGWHMLLQTLKKYLTLPFILKHTTPNTFQFSFLLEHE